MQKLKYLLFTLMALVALLSGCHMQTVSELYCLPKHSADYNNLQSLISGVMSGCEYSAPVSGDNQQTVQSVDLDGDGAEEYLLFAKETGDKTLKIFVFDGDGENYQLLDSISCSGSSFDRVEYAQIDGAPGYEIIVGRQVSDQVVRSVSVYSLKQDEITQMMSAEYTEFVCCDFNKDGLQTLLVLYPGEGNGLAALYGFDGITLGRSQEINMSQPAENIKRIMISQTQDGLRAVYVASAVSDSDSIITDVFAEIDGQLTNISLSNESGTSVGTLRNYYIYADDIDDDGVLELPNLLSFSPAFASNVVYESNIIRWYSLNSDGTENDKLYTYHNFVGGWYLRLDPALAQICTVEEKGTGYAFCIWDVESSEFIKVFTLYSFTGQKREEYAIADNRFVVYRGESTVYAASLEAASAEFDLTQESIIESFRLIRQDWKTGET